MVKGQVKSIMKEALTRFAKENNIETQKVKIFVHPKNKELEPLYFSLINGVRTDLDFKKDILAVKIEFLPRTSITAKFFQETFFPKVIEEYKIESETIYLMIGCSDIEAENLTFAVYENGKLLRKLQLSDVFGND
jgi:hypothetical protein